MEIKDKDIEKIKLSMIKKYGKTNFSALADELGVSRTAIYKAKNNDKAFDKLREKMIDWAKGV